jgi:hypothetical protein
VSGWNVEEPDASRVEMVRMRQRRRYLAMHAQGLCACGGTPRAGRTTCMACGEAAKERAAKQYAARAAVMEPARPRSLVAGAWTLSKVKQVEREARPMFPVRSSWRIGEVG